MAAKTTSNQSIAARIQLWVRRGALRRFHLLKRDTAHLPVTVGWDRRDPESNSTREQERRAAPSFTWETADFVVGGSTPETEQQ